SQSPIAGTVISDTTIVTLTVTDEYGNNSSCQFSVFTQENTNPVINSCAQDTLVTLDASCNYTLPDFTNDADLNITECSSYIVTQNPTAGTVISDTTTVTLTVTDEYGNNNSCQFNVFTQDTANPVINSCAQDTLVTLDTNCNYALPDFTNDADLNITECSNYSITQNPVAGTVINDTTIVTLNATDEYGNSSSCQFSIFTQDNINPVINSCAQDTSIILSPLNTYTLPDFTNDADLNITECSSYTVTQNPTAGTSISDTTIITLTVTDEYGNNNSCQFNVFTQDTANPVINSCAQDTLVTLDASCNYTLPDFTNDADLVIIESNYTVSQSPIAGTIINDTTTITLTVTDEYGNSSSCQFSIFTQDTANPGINSCAQDTLVTLDASCNYTLPDFTNDPDLNITECSSYTVTQSPVAGTIISDTTTVTLNATDEYGNNSSCQFSVFTQDTANPVINSCAQDTLVTLDASCSYTLPDFTNNADLNITECSSYSITQNPVAGTVISDTTTITLTVTDEYGNNNTCQFSVFTQDNTNPVINSCAQDTLVTLDATCNYTLPDFTNDADLNITECSSYTVSQNPVAGTVISDTTTITLTVTDEYGNNNTCLFNVFTQDTVNPVINSCAQDTMITLDASCNYTLPDFTNDADLNITECSSYTVSQNPIAGTVINDTTTITLTVTDEYGNTNQCSFNINTIDTIPPIAICQDITTQLDPNTGIATISPSNINNGSFDNCGLISLSISQSNFDCTHLGDNIVTLTVNDEFGNTSTCNATVHVEYQTTPNITINPSADTICNNERLNIAISSNINATLFSWTANAHSDIIGENNGMQATIATITDSLTNIGDTARLVTYTITPRIYGLCDLEDTVVNIWVNPSPKISVSSIDTILCDSSDITFNITSLSGNIIGNKYYYLETTYTSGNILGVTSDGYYPIANFTDNLINTTNQVQFVIYRFSAKIKDPESGTPYCHNGSDTSITIYINPTPQFNVSITDTIVCDSSNIILSITDLLGTTNADKVYDLTTSQTGGIIGIEPNAEFPISTNVTDQLINTTNQVQSVTYNFSYRLEDSRNGNPFCDHGIDTNITVYVNPSPLAIITITNDTICNDSYTEISLTSPTTLINGNVTFDYTSTTDIGLVGNSSGLSSLGNGYIISDSLHNSTALPAIPLIARYRITPKASSIGCPDGVSIVDSVTVHPTPDTRFINIDSVRCYSETNGRVTVVAQNTINLFSYEWSDLSQQTTATAVNLSKGIYRVTVTDNQSCIKVDSVSIEEPNELFVREDSLANVSCFGEGNGYISVDPIGANGRYTYVWQPTGINTRYLENISGGDYRVTVTDFKGCQKDSLFTIIEPGQPIIGLSSSNITCSGANDGWIEVTSPAISYLWSTNDTVRRINNLSPDNYTVTITTGDNCQAISGRAITEPDPLVTHVTATNIVCAGDENGTITLTAEGGNDELDYTYNWFSPDGIGFIANNQNQINLSGGTYYVTVSDYRNCFTVDTIYVGEPPLFSSSINYENNRCFGDSTGWISIIPTGGNGNKYSYEWTNNSGTSFADTSYLENLDAGEYSVIIRDTALCEIFDTIVITEPDLLDILPSYTNPSCFGYQDGTIKITITGGNGNYVINWSNNATTDSIYGLSGGIYSVLVTDSKNCSATDSIRIVEPDEIISNKVFNNITCFDSTNGSIQFSPTGGMEPYSYIWSHDNILTRNEASNLSPGDYLVSIIDSNNCIKIDSTRITQPDPIELLITKTDISCHNLTNGAISLSATGGTPSYSYIWSNGLTSDNGRFLSKGNYYITINDQNNCSTDTVVEIIEPQKLTISPEIRKPSCPDVKDGYIELNPSGGTSPYFIYWNNLISEQELLDIRTGIYNLHIEDDNSCKFDTSFVIQSESNFCIDIPTAFTPNGDTYNEKWVIDMKGLYPNVEIEVFDRWGKRVFFSKGYEEAQYWDGTYKGKKLPMDAYYYIINLKNGAAKLSGTISIIR
ncbi:MAG: gliding motility-associated C-terminal domain-containing protein, partial [Bacteroidales bacterium]|nr:gliding motility-associated C-terminal domain-containing protein [Bacteroidales bacterium]